MHNPGATGGIVVRMAGRGVARDVDAEISVQVLEPRTLVPLVNGNWALGLAVRRPVMEHSRISVMALIVLGNRSSRSAHAAKGRQNVARQRAHRAGARGVRIATLCPAWPEVSAPRLTLDFVVWISFTEFPTRTM